MFVFLALLEYAVILYLKNMKGTHKTIVRSEVLAITKIPAVDANWSNQQVTFVMLFIYRSLHLRQRLCGFETPAGPSFLFLSKYWIL